jgi:hypothetical protein
MQSWSIYCLVATGAVGVLLMQNAFNAGPLHSSLPTITAGEPVAGILLGIAVFGDRVSLTPSSLAIQAGGLFALVVGVILVARAPALSNLRKVVTEPVRLPHAIPLPHPHRRDPGSHQGRADAVAGGGRPEQQAPRLQDSAPAPVGPVSPVGPASTVAPVGPISSTASPISSTNGNISPTNGNGTNGLMAPAEPPRAVPPDEVLEPLETREIAEF